MTPDPKDTKARLDKALAEIKLFQEKLKNLSPEQREMLREKVREQAPQLQELKARLEAASAMFADRKGALPDRIANKLAVESPYLDILRKAKSKKEFMDEWGEAWMIPPKYLGRRASLHAGKGIAKFWSETVSLLPEKREALEPMAAVWNTAPMLVLPAITTHLSSLIVESVSQAHGHSILPFDMTAKIIKRFVVEVQLQSGVDPAPTEKLDEVLNALAGVAGGDSFDGDSKELTLRAMFLYAWLAHGLPKNPLGA